MIDRAKDKRKAGWIGVDFDGTLAHYDRWRGLSHVGEPIKPMCDRVRAWLAEGKEVKIFTARISTTDIPHEIVAHQVRKIKTPIQNFCVREFAQTLEITNVKDFDMIELWDDRAVQVEKNTGLIWNQMYD